MSADFGLDDVLVIEQGTDDENEYFIALQRAINSGHAWKMQGSMGRAMMDAIASGRCMLGPNDCRDYWGSHIPSRSQVKEGTKGSRQFIVDNYGEEWAALMEAA